MKSLIKNENGSGSAFVWAAIIFTFFMTLFIWTPLMEGIIPMQQYANEFDAAAPSIGLAQDPMLPYVHLIINYFPIWLLLGLTIIGLARGQKQDYGA